MYRRSFSGAWEDCVDAGGSYNDATSQCNCQFGFNTQTNRCMTLEEYNSIASQGGASQASGGGGTVSPGVTKVVPYQTTPSFFSQHPFLILGGAALAIYVVYRVGGK